MSDLFNLAFISYILVNNPTMTGIVIVILWIAFMVVTTILTKEDFKNVHNRARKTNQ